MATTPTSKTISRRVSSISAKNHGSYNINQLCYPAEITTDPDKLHSVSFFINVRGKSKFKTNHPNKIVGQLGMSGENRTDPEVLGKATGIAVGGTAGVLAGMGIGRTIMQGSFARAAKAGITKSTLGSLATVAVGAATGAVAAGGIGAAGAAVGALASNLLIQPDTTYRISDVITLHVSSAPSTTHSASYDNVEVGALIGAVSSGLSATDSARKAMMPDVARAAMMKGMAIAGKKLLAKTDVDGFADMISGTKIDNAIKLSSGQNLNPFREVLFQSVGFREFEFNYKFYPRSQAETDHVKNIVKTFKYHQHPELSTGGLYMIHPSEFNIAYYYNGKENQNVHKISTCVLKDLHVDYGGETFATFADGAPVEISLRLTFRELEILTKDRIDEGF